MHLFAGGLKKCPLLRVLGTMDRVAALAVGGTYATEARAVSNSPRRPAPTLLPT